MSLKSFGCSFIFGTDLADHDRDLSVLTASDYTWPAHVSRHLGYDYKCYAWPGSGNLQILERMLNQLPQSSSDDLFVIGWSWIDRFDYYDKECFLKLKHWWSTVMPNDETHEAKAYYKYLHSEYCDKLTCLTYIKSAIDALDQQKIPFIMTYQDELLFDTRWHTSPAVQYLQNFVKPRMTMFDGHTFLDWSREQQYPESETWHPLEEAHAAAAELIIKSYNLI